MASYRHYKIPYPRLCPFYDSNNYACNREHGPFLKTIFRINEETVVCMFSTLFRVTGLIRAASTRSGMSVPVLYSK